MSERLTPLETQRKDGKIVAFPMIASETVYKGSTVMVKSATGLAFTNDGTTNTLAVGDIFVGIAVETITSGAIAGADYIRVETDGLHLLTFSDTLSQANVGDNVFVNNVSDDGVVTITQDTGNAEVCIGKVFNFVSANTAFVKIEVGQSADVSPGNSSIADGSISAVKLAGASVTKSKLSYEVATISIVAGTSGTATVVTGGEILGWYVTAITGTERVKTIGLSGTTLTVTLTGSDTATIKVVVLKA